MDLRHSGIKIKIGLEIHAALLTSSKLFCRCSTRWQGREPNTLTCPVCLGMPGSKPVLNEKAVEYAIRIALALNCKIARECFFSRKSYFYPDMAKNFQITQYEIPIASNGYVELDGKKIRIKRVHLEEDPARLVHVGPSVAEARYVLIDYNRSGVPLCEIVTEPDLTSPREAREFLQRLANILEYLDVYDSSLEGSMRVDANISIQKGSMASERVEIKNISGFKELEEALTFEAIRQANALERGEKIPRETRGYDSNARVTYSLRGKELEEEYGYIFEPDLPKLRIEKSFVERIKRSLPELPHQKMERLSKFINKELAKSIVSDKDLALAYERVIKHVDKKLAAVWLGNVLKKILNYNNLRFKDVCITHEQLVRFLKALEKGEITKHAGEQILRELIRDSSAIERIVEMKRISDENLIKNVAVKVLEANPKAVLDYKSGKREAFEFLIGCVMRETKGRADPKKAREVLKRMLD